MTSKIKMKQGEIFGELSYVADSEPYIGPDGKRKRKCIWLCSCGNKTVAVLSNVRRGLTKSCGCIMSRDWHSKTHVARSKITSAKRKVRKNLTRVYEKHNMTGSAEYVVWTTMLNRCKHVYNPKYRRHAGRGISVCKRWRSFSNFYADMGPRPSAKHEIDRENNNGNYEPGNCRWVLRRFNQQNTCASKRWVLFGLCFLSSDEAAKFTGLSQSTVCQWCDGLSTKSRRTPQKTGCYSYRVY